SISTNGAGAPNPALLTCTLISPAPATVGWMLCGSVIFTGSTSRSGAGGTTAAWGVRMGATSRQSRARKYRAHSSPKPEEQPVISTVFIAGVLAYGGRVTTVGAGPRTAYNRKSFSHLRESGNGRSTGGDDPAAQAHRTLLQAGGRRWSLAGKPFRWRGILLLCSARRRLQAQAGRVRHGGLAGWRLRPGAGRLRGHHVQPARGGSRGQLDPGRAGKRVLPHRRATGPDRHAHPRRALQFRFAGCRPAGAADAAAHPYPR